MIADDFVWPADVAPQEPFEAMVKIRLASRPVKAVIAPYFPSAEDKEKYTGQPYKITFETPQRAVAPGQSAVIFKDSVIAGGGFISKPLRKR